MNKRNMGKAIVAIGLTAIVLSGCGEGSQENTANGNQTINEEVPMATQDVFAMDTYMTITGYGENCEEAVAKAVEEIQRLDNLFSVGNPESEIAMVNSDGSLIISSDTATVIEQALDLYDSTGGVFDISIYPVMELWGFTTDTCREPSIEELEAVLEYVDASQIQFDAEKKTLEIQAGQGIDLGGIAKGYTSDRVMLIFEEYGLVSGLVDLGGNVQCYSGKVDGSPWRCGVQDPDDESGILCVVSVKDKAIITSGGYERFFTDEETGNTWHHIIDPATGYSANNGLSSVTIVSEKGMLADGLSTSMYIMGLDNAIDYWKEHKESYDMILVTEDRKIYVTEGISDAVSCEYPYEVISLGKYE